MSTVETEPITLAGVVSGACNCDRCISRTTSIYRMVGRCHNCLSWVLMLFRAGDDTRALDCPVCGCWHKVHAQRLATPDEIPAAVSVTPERTEP